MTYLKMRQVFVLTMLAVISIGSESVAYDGCDNSVPCIRKCCLENQVFDTKSRKCSSSGTTVFQVPVYDGTRPVQNYTPFHILHDKTCPVGHDKLLLNPNILPDKFYVQRNGSMFKPNDKAIQMIPLIPFDKYCLDIVVTDTVGRLSAIVCYSEEEIIDEKQLYSSVGKLLVNIEYSLQSLRGILIYYFVYEGRGRTQTGRIHYNYC